MSKRNRDEPEETRPTTDPAPPLPPEEPPPPTPPDPPPTPPVVTAAEPPKDEPTETDPTIEEHAATAGVHPATLAAAMTYFHWGVGRRCSLERFTYAIHHVENLKFG